MLSGQATPGVGWAGRLWPPPFLGNKGKQRKKRKSFKVSKQKLLKGCHQGQNVTVLAILERLELKNLFYRPTIVLENTFHCSMAPPL